MDCSAGWWKHEADHLPFEPHLFVSSMVSGWKPSIVRHLWGDHIDYGLEATLEPGYVAEIAFPSEPPAPLFRLELVS